MGYLACKIVCVNIVTGWDRVGYTILINTTIYEANQPYQGVCGMLYDNITAERYQSWCQLIARVIELWW